MLAHRFGALLVWVIRRKTVLAQSWVCRWVSCREDRIGRRGVWRRGSTVDGLSWTRCWIGMWEERLVKSPCYPRTRYSTCRRTIYGNSTRGHMCITSLLLLSRPLLRAQRSCRRPSLSDTLMKPSKLVSLKTYSPTRQYGNHRK